MRLALALTVAFVLVAAIGSGTPARAQSDELEAPTDLSFLGNTLRWTDNSTDEDGFRILAQAFNGDAITREYPVGPNVTEFAVPEEVLPSCPDRPSARYEVFAFRDDIESEGIEVGVIGECRPLTPTAAPPSTPAVSPPTESPPTVVFPATGKEPRQTNVGIVLETLAALVGLIACVVGTGRLARTRSHDNFDARD
ncbi:MAG: hypothetical protein WD359_06730 [Dehalococcoidia bacterium]